MQIKIDCSIAENYITEHERICKAFLIKCNDCPLEHIGFNCCDWVIQNPKQAVEIVQAWSDEHPIEPVVTYLDKFKNAFPKAELKKSGAPKLCLQQIQDVDCFGNCFNCWNQPYKENEK
jgi:hypothetical protein